MRVCEFNVLGEELKQKPIMHCKTNQNLVVKILLSHTRLYPIQVHFQNEKVWFKFGRHNSDFLNETVLRAVYAIL